MSKGIYIHVPFCLRKCPYCDFYSVEYNVVTAKKYVDALCSHIMEYKKYDIEVDTIYFGGGTPSLFFPNQIRRIIRTIRKCFDVRDAEITLEANPSSVDYEKLCGYREAGVNRISFGVQSADDRQLGFLGRLHDFSSASKAVMDAEKAGFDNISCDFMLGLAGQSMESLNETIDRITALPIKHISAYMLKIEQGTAFDNNTVRKAVADDDKVSDMYLNTVQRLEKLGFEQYEISNFAKDKCYSRHNLKYWQGEEYIGFGAAAHSFFGGKRFCYPRDVLSYIENRENAVVVTENEPDPCEEYIMLSLRLKWGISLERVAELGGHKLSDNVKRKAEIYSKNGLCIVDNGRVSLTPKGFLLSNSIISEFLG